MDEIDKAVKKLEGIQTTFGFIGVIVVIAIALVGYLIYKYLVKSVESSAEEASQKAVASFQISMEKQLEAKLNLFFRDENIRNDITSHFAIKSIETKLKVWVETYQLYFDFQKTWLFDKETLDLQIGAYDDNLQKNRELIFLNSVYLGGFLTSKLITLNNSIRNSIRSQYRFNHANPTSAYLSNLEIEKNKHMEKIEEILPEVQTWIEENLNVDHNSKMWDFSKEQLEIISEERNKKFEDIAELKKQ